MLKLKSRVKEKVPKNVVEWDCIVAETIDGKELIECIYILNKDGVQISNTIMNPFINIENLTNFHPALPGDNHSMKKYYTQSVRKNGEIYISHEYISTAKQNICCTYSQSIKITKDEEFVICVDMRF